MKLFQLELEDVNELYFQSDVEEEMPIPATLDDDRKSIQFPGAFDLSPPFLYNDFLNQFHLGHVARNISLFFFLFYFFSHGYQLLKLIIDSFYLCIFNLYRSYHSSQLKLMSNTVREWKLKQGKTQQGFYPSLFHCILMHVATLVLQQKN